MSDNLKENTDQSVNSLQEVMGNGLVFSYDYYPAIPFQVVAGLQQPTVADILGGTEPDQAVVSDPTDYNGYVIRYQTGGGGIYSFVFIQDQALQQGSTYRFTGNVGFFNVQANLVSASMASGSGSDSGEDTDTTTETTTTETTTTTEAPTDETTTTTTNETTTETTQEVVVNATETTTEGG